MGKELESNVNAHKKKCMELEQELIDTKTSLAIIASSEEAIAKELHELRAAHGISKKCLEEKGRMIQGLTNDLFTQQKEQSKGESSYKEQIATLSVDLESKKQEIQKMHVDVENMTNDLSKLREENTSAQQNYERELGLHANARTELRMTK